MTDRPFSPAHRDDFEAAIERWGDYAYRVLENPESSDIACVEAHVLADAMYALKSAMHEPWSEYECFCDGCTKGEPT